MRIHDRVGAHRAIHGSTPAERESNILRIEMGLPCEAVAERRGKPTAAATDVAVGRALVRLVREMSSAPRRTGRQPTWLPRSVSLER